MTFKFNSTMIGILVKMLEAKNDYSVRINRAGNLTVNGKNEHWTLYKCKNGKYLWRRHNELTGYCYPLNMKGRKSISVCSYDNLTFYHKDWNMRLCEFDNIIDAYEYFKHYLIKYRKLKC